MKKKYAFDFSFIFSYEEVAFKNSLFSVTARAINFERERGPFKLFPVLLMSGSRSFSTCIQDVHGEKKGKPGYLEGIKISAIDTSNILDKKTYEPE